MNKKYGRDFFHYYLFIIHYSFFLNKPAAYHVIAFVEHGALAGGYGINRRMEGYFHFSANLFKRTQSPLYPYSGYGLRPLLLHLPTNHI